MILETDSCQSCHQNEITLLFNRERETCLQFLQGVLTTKG